MDPESIMGEAAKTGARVASFMVKVVLRRVLTWGMRVQMPISRGKHKIH